MLRRALTEGIQLKKRKLECIGIDVDSDLDEESEWIGLCILDEKIRD